MMNKAKQNGVGLIELVFVIALIAVFILAAAARYNKLKIRQNAIVINNSVNLIFEGIKEFYFSQCQALSHSNYLISIEASLYPDFISNLSLIRNPLNETSKDPLGLKSYKVYLSWDYNSARWLTHIEMTVSSNLKNNKKDLLETYAALLEPTFPLSQTNYTFKWVQPVRINPVEGQGEFNPQKSSIGRFAIEQFVPGDIDRYKPFRPDTAKNPSADYRLNDPCAQFDAEFIKSRYPDQKPLID